MKKKLALVDLDGTLVDFPSACFRYFWKPYPNPWPERKDVIAALGMRPNDFWNQISGQKDFWASMAWLPDGKNILTEIEREFETVLLCSSPSFCPYSAAGKLAWIQENLPEYERRYCLTPVKEAYAKVPGAYLFDDSERNIEKFVNAGGHGILIKRPWSNH